MKYFDTKTKATVWLRKGSKFWKRLRNKLFTIWANYNKIYKLIYTTKTFQNKKYQILFGNIHLVLHAFLNCIISILNDIVDTYFSDIPISLEMPVIHSDIILWLYSPFQLDKS